MKDEETNPISRGFRFDGERFIETLTEYDRHSDFCSPKIERKEIKYSYPLEKEKAIIAYFREEIKRLEGLISLKKDCK